MAWEYFAFGGLARIETRKPTEEEYLNDDNLIEIDDSELEQEGLQPGCYHYQNFERGHLAGTAAADIHWRGQLAELLYDLPLVTLWARPAHWRAQPLGPLLLFSPANHGVIGPQTAARLAAELAAAAELVTERAVTHYAPPIHHQFLTIYETMERIFRLVAGTGYVDFYLP